MSITPKIIITVDDAAAFDILDEGILSFCKTLIPNRVAAFSNYYSLANFALMVPQEVQLGIHFNISSGTPLNQPFEIPSLVNEDGSFKSPTPSEKKEMFNSLSSFISFVNTISIREEIKKEFEAQFNRYFDLLNKKPDFITVHHDLDKAPNVRNVIESLKLGKSCRQTALLNKELSGILCIFLEEEDNLDTAIEKILVMINEAKILSKRFNGLPCEIVCHPGFYDTTLDQFTVYGARRRLEFKAWTSSRVLDVLKNGIRKNEYWIFK